MERTQLNEGKFDSTLAAPQAQTNDNDDADANTTYQKDIIDVYIDSDADGIPDAWDIHPEYFDADANGILDGNQLVGGAFNGAEPDVIPNATPSTDFEVSPGKPYYKSTPYTSLGGFEGVKVAKYLPDIKQANFVKITANDVLYYDNGVNYVRNYPTWPAWTGFIIFDLIRMGIQTPFSHTNLNLLPANLELRRSDELNYLENQDIFSATSYIRRVPENIWP